MSNLVLDTIAARRSHRAYQDKPLSQEHIDLMLKAFLESPSAINKQPWHISVVRSKKLLDEMNEAIRSEVMKRDAAARSPRFADSAFHVFYHAPLVFFLSADPAWR